MFKYVKSIPFYFILFISCEVGEDFVPDNPLDPTNPEYIAPQISITSSPTKDETINTSQYTFSWEGNRDGMFYRYALDKDWSDWLEEQKTVTIDHMDEGVRQFSVQSKYTSSDTSSVASVRFTVDAVKGPALLFYPRLSKATLDQTLELSLLAEEVINLSGAEVTLTFDASALEIIDVSKGDLFNELGDVIFIEDHSLSGNVTISTAVWGQDQPGASGTKSLAKIQVRVKKFGNTTIEINNSSSLRDPNNLSITINQLIGGIIESN